jgi:ASC-1-like (ASCH) protein
MKLQPSPFNRIKEGTKIIEARLNDEKRQQIKLGDTIEFQKEPEKEEKLQTEVVGLLNYPTFKDLINDFPIEYFGSIDKETLIQDVHKFYTEEDEKQFGILGIKINLA